MDEFEKMREERLALMKDYQVNRELMNHTKNSEVFMYCLSAYYSFETFIGKKIGEKFHGNSFEVTDEIFKISHSLVFKEAANCMHTIKAVSTVAL